MREDYYWNYLFNECQDVFNDTYKHTLDIQDFVPLKSIEKTQKQIRMRQDKVCRQINREARRHFWERRKALAKERKQSRLNAKIDLVPSSFVSRDGKIIYLLPSPANKSKGEQANVQEEKRAEE